MGGTIAAYAQGVVVAKEVSAETFEAACALTQDYSFEMTGCVRK